MTRSKGRMKNWCPNLLFEWRPIWNCFQSFRQNTFNWFIPWFQQTTGKIGQVDFRILRYAFNDLLFECVPFKWTLNNFIIAFTNLTKICACPRIATIASIKLTFWKMKCEWNYKYCLIWGCSLLTLPNVSLHWIDLLQKLVNLIQ